VGRDAWVSVVASRGDHEGRRLRHRDARLGFCHLQRLCYNTFGERTQWAKAHFFVSREFCRGFPPLDSQQEKTVKTTAMREGDLDKITEMAQRVAVSEGLTLVDVELKGGGGSRLLRVYIDKADGVSHADCELASEQLSAMLDVEDLIPGSYTLEVSSPGLDRKLVKASDFAHFAGRKARVVVREPVDDQKVLEGRLAGFEAGRVRIDLGDAGLRELELSNIQKARLVVEI